MIFVHEPRNRIHRRSIDSRKRRPYRRGPLCSRLDPRSIAISWLCGVSSESNGPTDPGIPFQNPVNVCGWVEAASWLAPRRCRYCSCKAPSSATETAESFHLIISLSGSAATTPLPLPLPHASPSRRVRFELHVLSRQAFLSFQIRNRAFREPTTFDALAFRSPRIYRFRETNFRRNWESSRIREEWRWNVGLSRARSKNRRVLWRRMSTKRNFSTNFTLAPFQLRVFCE